MFTTTLVDRTDKTKKIKTQSFTTSPTDIQPQAANSAPAWALSSGVEDPGAFPWTLDIVLSALFLPSLNLGTTPGICLVFTHALKQNLLEVTWRFTIHFGGKAKHSKA